jgi:hypothetical protein
VFHHPFHLCPADQHKVAPRLYGGKVVQSIDHLVVPKQKVAIVLSQKGLMPIAKVSDGVLIEGPYEVLGDVSLRRVVTEALRFGAFPFVNGHLRLEHEIELIDADLQQLQVKGHQSWVAYLGDVCCFQGFNSALHHSIAQMQHCARSKDGEPRRRLTLLDIDEKDSR